MAYFLVLEGSEGCGKSEQLFYLAKNLFSFNKFFSVLLTREPYKSREIRSILEEDLDPLSKSKRLTDLFIRDRIEHLEGMVLRNLVMGVTVISDRYKYSTIAYQSCQGEDLDYLVKRHEGMLVPDITLVLDVPVKASIKRLRKRKDKIKEKKFETSKEFLEQLRNAYLRMPDILKNENIVIVNGNKKPKKVAEEIWGHVRQIL